MSRKRPTIGGPASQSGQHRFANAARAMKRFLNEPRTATPAVHIIGPVQHAARYNRAFRQSASDAQEQPGPSAELDVTGFMLVVDDQHLTHSTRQHGRLATEAKRGQLPVKRDCAAHRQSSS